jgi:hypothetical protein
MYIWKLAINHQQQIYVDGRWRSQANKKQTNQTNKFDYLDKKNSFDKENKCDYWTE